MAIKYKQCPKCGSKNSLRIIYGMPSHELFEEAEAGIVRLGGCCIFESDPEYFCKDCENEWNRDQAIDEAYGKIKAIRASVGGYFGGYYNVEIEIDTLKVTWSHGGNGEEEETVLKTIRAITATKFIEQLKMVDILNWKAKYVEPDVCDGIQWNVEIVTNVRTAKIYGDNKFPDEWDLFCKLIGRIVRKPF